jgi:hypothetical protein
MPQRRWVRGLSVGALAGLLALAATRAAADNEASEARMRRDVTYLASPECEGRGVDTEGINKAADYIAGEFKKAGLKPGGPKGSYFQPFSISVGVSKLKGPGKLVLRGPQGQTVELTAGKDFEVTVGSGPGTVNAPLVFAGYGVTEGKDGYDDYKGADVAGKVVVVLRRVPRWDNSELPFGGSERAKASLAALIPKFANAQTHKAAAVLLVNDASELPKGDLLQRLNSIPAPNLNLPILHVRRSALDPVLLSSLGRGLPELERAIDRDLKPRTAPLAGWSARVEAPIQRTATYAVKNVIGVLEGAGPLKDETVVIGAHYDHWGFGGAGSLAKDRSKKQLHPGADDNGSGTTAVMELARRFAAVKNRQGRRLVFMTFTGEERGLLGSLHYCNKDPLFPLKDTVAMINLDMVGRLRPDKKTQKDRLIVEGVQTAKGFDELIEKFNKKHDFTLTKRPGNSFYSDHASFYRKGVPIFFLWTDTHPDYHRPSDTADKINIQGMRRITDLAEELARHFTTVRERPEHVVIKGIKGPVRPRKGPTLGFVPGGYADGENAPKGVKVEEVIEGRPAAKAGIKAGDLIVEVAGKPVANITAYTAILQDLQPRSTIEVTIVRGGKRQTLKVMLD